MGQGGPNQRPPRPPPRRQRAARGNVSALSVPNALRSEADATHGRLLVFKNAQLQLSCGAGGTAVSLGEWDGSMIVAVKRTLLPRDPVARRRALREKDLLKGLAHAHIVKFVDYATCETALGSWLFLAMEPCVERLPSGQFVSCTLEWLVRGGAASAHHRAMGWRDVCIDLARDMSAGLAFLHSTGIDVLHRDLKPENVLVAVGTGPGGAATLTAKLADLGHSRREGATTTVAYGVGTAGWFAPEVDAGRQNSRAGDVFSLGACPPP